MKHNNIMWAVQGSYKNVPGMGLEIMEIKDMTE